MKKIIVRKNNEDKIVEFMPIEQDIQLWEESKKLESKWMKSERIIPLIDATQEEIASAIETIPAVMDGEEQVSPEMIKLPKTYEIIVTDISSQIAQEAINKQAKDLLASTDWKCLRHKDQVDLGVPTSMTEQEYQDLLQARQAARDSIV